MESKEIHSILDSYQTGMAQPDEDVQIEVGGTALEQQAPEQEETAPPSFYQRMRQGIRMSPTVSEDYTEQALASGFGTSKYDTAYTPATDVEHNRALGQSWFAKVGTGLAKGGVTALSTLINTTAGTLWGVGSGLYELAADTNGNGRSFMDTLDAGVNNWVSEQTVKLQNWSEEFFPNYRTQEERTDKYQKEWYKHIYTGNFIGDSILKNFGFTIGAMGGGMAWSKLLSKAMSRRLAGNIMKGVVAAADGDEAATAELTRALEALKRGTVVGVDASKLSGNMLKAARQLNRAEARLQLYGATISAMGEGTVEGLMAKDEFLQEQNTRIEQQFADEYAAAEQTVLASGNPEFVRKRLYIQPDGSLEPRLVLTPRGEEERDRLRQEAADKYSDLTRFAEEQGERLASTTYLLNLPILTVSNVIQFGRLFSGGWKTNRANAVRGGMTINGDEITGAYRPKGSVWGRTILNSLKVAGTESAEEMLQGVASSGTKEVARHRLSSFNDMGYDDEATHSVRSWFSDMYSGGVEYLADPKNWQEGFLGALTGLFGIPGRKWHGGIPEALRDARDATRSSKEAADALNARVNSKEFQDLWRGYIRHLKFDNDMGRATADDNQYAWHTANDAQLISDVMMFADAGRLDDLDQLVSHYGSLSAADAQGIRDMLKGDGKAADDFVKNASDNEIVERVKKQADKIKETIQEYKDMYDALSARAPMGASDEFLRELVFTAQQVKAFDRRFLQMLGETLTAIDPFLEAISSVNTETGEALTEEESKQRYEALRNNYERIFAGTLIPVNLPKDMQKSIDDSLNLLDEMTKDDAELHTKVTDMRKLADDRRNFYEKLRTLQEPKAQERFEEEAVTQERVDDAADEAAIQQETNELDTLDKVKESYFKIINAKERAQYADDLRRVEDSNPSVKKFLDIKRKYDAFRKYIESNPITSPDITVNYAMTYGLVDDLLRNAKNPEDFDTLPDYMFPSEENFDSRNTSILGLKSPTAYKNAIAAVRQSMQEFLQLESDTETRKTISPTPLEFTPAPESVSEPTGRDAAQPGSLVPTPEPERKDDSSIEKSEVSVTFTGKAGDERTATYTINKNSKGFEASVKEGSNKLTVDVADMIDAGLSRSDFLVVGGLNESEFENGTFALNTVNVDKDGSVTLNGTINGKIAGILGSRGSDTKSVLRAIAPELAKALGVSETTETESSELEEADEDIQVESEVTKDGAGAAEAAAYDMVPDVPQSMQDERLTPNGTHYQTPYYRTSVPEISTTEAKNAREAMKNNYWDARSKADLSDFVLSHPEYAPVWNALEQRGAFRYTATKLRVGDDILLAIDPTFPKYKGEDQILICTRDSEGRLQVLNTLSYQGNQYFGLYALRGRVKDEYDKFSKRNPNGVFVFSKKSRVWGLRGGLIDYDYSGKTENAVSQMAGHEDGSVVFLNREMSPVTVVGDGSLAENNSGVLQNIINKSKQTKKTGKDETRNRAGTLYFLSQTGRGAVPIALNVRHFNEENMETDTPTFQKIRDSISRIADIVRGVDMLPTVREFNDVVTEPVLDAEGNPVLDESGNPATQPVMETVLDENGRPVLDENGKETTREKTEKVRRTETWEEFSERQKEQIEEQNRKLHEELKTLRQELDIHKWFFNIEEVNVRNDDGTTGTMIALRVNNGAAAAEAGEQQKSYLIRPNQATDNQMLKFFAKLDCAVDVRLRTPSRRPGATQTSIVEAQKQNLDAFKNRVSELFNEGILTTNARKLHPKGTDFYFDAWDDAQHEFRPLTTAQAMLREEQNRQEVEEQQIAEEIDSVPVIPEDAESVEVVQRKDENQSSESSPTEAYVISMSGTQNNTSRFSLGAFDSSTSQQESQGTAVDESGQTEQEGQESEHKSEADIQSDGLERNTFSEQPEIIHKWILEQMTAGEFDTMSVSEREKVLRCL